MRHENGAYHPNRTLIPVVVGLKPDPKKTPWWARGMKYSHLALYMGGYIWDQPMWDVGGVYDAVEWAEEKGEDRLGFMAACRPSKYTFWNWPDSVPDLSGRRGQPIRSALRYLGLWPRPAWNCTSPVRIVLGCFGIRLTGETPDDIFRELTEHPSNRVTYFEHPDPRSRRMGRGVLPVLRVLAGIHGGGRAQDSGD